MADKVTVALIGNPNTGKSTVFNALSGLNQRTGNYPGVTVEKKIGRFQYAQVLVEVVDLPGTYSLAARSPDEMVAVDVMLGASPGIRLDGIVVVVDANNLERNLFLFSQLMSLQRPLILALNMSDVAARNGVKVDVTELQQRLRVPVISMQANKGIGIGQLKEAIAQIGARSGADGQTIFPGPIAASIDRLAERLAGTNGASPGFLAQRLIFDSSDAFRSRFAPPHSELRAEIARAKHELAETGYSLSSIESVSRYQWIENLLQGVASRPTVTVVTTSDRIDRVLTHRFWGTLIFASVILLVFQAVFAWSQPLMEWIESAFGWVQASAASWLPAGTVESLIVNGVLGGISGVIEFVPQIMILFFFIAIMEDCGYLARAAYLMDKLMSRIGLSGKSFIPLLSSFACAIPGIMATRIIENRRDRLITILVAPLMSCHARLPVYTLLISAFIPHKTFLGGVLTLQGLTLFGLYLLGIVTAVVVATVLRKSILRGETPPFVMELPEYKRPSIRIVLGRMLERGWAFVRRAGSLIVSVSILIWAATYFPRMDSNAPNVIAAATHSITQTNQRPDVPTAKEVKSALAAAQLRNSYLGRTARIVEPLVRPVGWDWKVAAAVIASFPAREIVVAALGVIYSLGDEEDAESLSLREKLKAATFDGTDQPVFTLPAALSLLVFFSLCAQCFSTLVVIYRETNSLVWPLFSFVYMTSLAYLAALITFQVGSLF